MSEVIKTVGIVLKSSKHTADAARLLEIFSPEMGRFSAVIRGVEKPKAKLAAASQPFCFGEFMLAEKKGFYTVTDCFVQDSFFDIVYDLDAYVLGSSMLEATTKFAQAGEKNVELFTLLLKSLKAMAYEKAEPTAVAIKFLMTLLEMSGFGFDLHNCSVCGKSLSNEKSIGLIYEGGGAICSADKYKVDCIDISLGEWGILKNIYNADISSLQGLKFSSRDALTSCLKILLKQVYFRTGEKIKSLESYF